MQDGDFKTCHVVGRREPTASWNFVTGIEELRVDYVPGIIFVIEAGAARDDGEAVIDLGVIHSRWKEHVLAHVVHIFLRGGSLHHTANKCVSLGRITEFGAWRGNQRITFKKIETSGNG